MDADSQRTDLSEIGANRLPCQVRSTCACASTGSANAAPTSITAGSARLSARLGKKRKQPPLACRIVTAKPPKPKRLPYTGPIIVEPSVTWKQARFLAWARAHAVKPEED